MRMFYSEEDKRRIADASQKRLLDVARDFHEFRKSGVSYVCDCPHCGATGKFSINPEKDLFGCWVCKDVNGNGAVDYLMRVEGKGYLSALEYLANRFNVLIDEKPKKPQKPASKMKVKSKAAKGQDTDSFCARMLSASGLTFEDVTARVYKSDDTRSLFELRTFRPGTIDEKGAIVKGDDVIIEYYDLDGMPVTYYRKDSKKRIVGDKKEYFRVRWQYPDEHLDKEGKPFKYKSPREAEPPSTSRNGCANCSSQRLPSTGCTFRREKRRLKPPASTASLQSLSAASRTWVWTSRCPRTWYVSLKSAKSRR